ncbi:MAG: hypothetical protein AB9846_10210 [Tenuifilaceae bacterium]
MKNRRWIFSLLAIIVFISGCKKESEISVKPIIILKNGDYTQDEEIVPVGGKLKFGITATDGNAIITNLRIQRIADGKEIIELDKGLYIKDGGLNYDFNATKSSANQEIWQFFVMNSNRDSSVTSIIVNLGAGSAYGEIYHYSSIKIGMQNNNELPNYVDLHTGELFTKSYINGNEHKIDLVGFVYTTSGIISPTLCCPGYTGSSSVTGKYPEISSWEVRNLTVYDYYSSDNNLISEDKFIKSQNDSLLVNSFHPQSVSGLCKYCNTGKIIPFRTEDGKYGLVHVLHADLTESGYMELEVKIQK